MDKQRIALIGAIVIAVVAMLGGLYFGAKQIPLPGWLVGLLAVVGTVFGLLAKSLFGDDSKGGAS